MHTPIIFDASGTNVLVDSFPLPSDIETELASLGPHLERESPKWRTGTASTKNKGLTKESVPVALSDPASSDTTPNVRFSLLSRPTFFGYWCEQAKPHPELVAHHRLLPKQTSNAGVASSRQFQSQVRNPTL